MKTKIAALAFLVVPSAALATPPNACEILKPEDINPIAVSKVERVQVQKAGNPSQCGFLDSRKAAVLVLSIREVQYAVKDELHEERASREDLQDARRSSSRPSARAATGARPTSSWDSARAR